MLKAFVNAFKIPDLRKKILFTIGIIAVFRLGSHIPVPNVDPSRLAELRSATTGQQLSALQFIDLFSGGATGIVRHFTPPRVALMVITLTAGTAMIMWLGELITQRGIGNGMSILIFTSVISRLPAQGTGILHQAGEAKFYFLLLLGIAIIVAVVWMEQGQRRIPVQYA